MILRRILALGPATSMERWREQKHWNYVPRQYK